jgi:hypothetical protein
MNPNYVQRDGENITVSATAIGPTAAKVTGNVYAALFWLKSGGKIHHNTLTTPTAAGVTGDIGRILDEKWEVEGADEVLNFKMVKQTSEPDAVVAVQYYGSGRT